MNLQKILFTLLFILLPTRFGIEVKEQLIVWNVGQGQWVSFIHQNECLHFDVGGETAPLAKIKGLCSEKNNVIFLSHDDFDHIKYAHWIKKQLAPCWSQENARELFFSRLKAKWATCSEKNNLVREIYRPSKKSQDKNAQSFVFSIGSVLIPGDAPKSSELKWRKNEELRHIKILILGHHGSRTSTSEELLKSLPQLNMSIASARYKKYRHPHAETQWRLKKNKTPILLTEDWGSISIEI